MTWGAEIEWADVDRSRPLPSGFALDTKEKTIANTNGIAVDSSGRFYKFGAEIHTPVCASPEELCSSFKRLVEVCPDAGLTHRNGIHIHCSLAGWHDRLEDLKRVSKFVHEKFRPVIGLLEPIASAEPCADMAISAWHAKRMKRSHQTFLSPERYAAQQNAITVEEFMQAEAPKKPDGKPAFHLATRTCVNLRQLMATGTIEFRHFFSSTEPDRFNACVEWVAFFVEAIQRDIETVKLREAALHFRSRIPREQPRFSLRLERNFRATDWSVDLKAAQVNAARILNGENL